MGALTKTGKFAVGFTFLGVLFVLSSMVSPYWLVSDGVLANPKFTNLGKSINKSIYIFLFNATTPLSNEYLFVF